MAHFGTQFQKPGPKKTPVERVESVQARLDRKFERALSDGLWHTALHTLSSSPMSGAADAARWARFVELSPRLGATSEVVKRVLHAAYAGEIPSSPRLFATIVATACSDHQDIDTAVEGAQLCVKAFGGDRPLLRDMTRHDTLDFRPRSEGTAKSNQANAERFYQKRQDQAQAQTLRSGSTSLKLDAATKRAMALSIARLCARTGHATTCSGVNDVLVPSWRSDPDFATLFTRASAAAGSWRAALELSGRDGQQSRLPLESFTPKSLSRIGLSAALEGRWEVSLACIESAITNSSADAFDSAERKLMDAAALQALAVGGQWEMALQLGARRASDARSLSDAACDMMFGSVPPPEKVPTDGDIARAKVVSSYFDHLSFELDEFNLPPLASGICAASLAVCSRWEISLRLLCGRFGRVGAPPSIARRTPQHVALSRALHILSTMAPAHASVTPALTHYFPWYFTASAAQPISSPKTAVATRWEQFRNRLTEIGPTARPTREDYFKRPRPSTGDVLRRYHEHVNSARQRGATAFDGADGFVAANNDPRPEPVDVFDASRAGQLRKVTSGRLRFHANNHNYAWSAKKMPDHSFTQDGWKASQPSSMKSVRWDKKSPLK